MCGARAERRGHRNRSLRSCEKITDRAQTKVCATLESDTCQHVVAQALACVPIFSQLPGAQSRGMEHWNPGRCLFLNVNNDASVSHRLSAIGSLHRSNTPSTQHHSATRSNAEV